MKSSAKLYRMSACAAAAALMCIACPITVPAGPISLSANNFIIGITVWILGKETAAVSAVIYVLLGLAGLPVFGGYRGGPSVLFGSEGGYILGYFL